jgi:hypothetical protein
MVATFFRFYCVNGIVAPKADGHPAATVCADHSVPRRFQTAFDYTVRLDVETLILANSRATSTI